MDKKELGKVIKTMRLSRGMTQDQLAKAIHMSQSTIGMWERGEREPDLESQEALADVFNVPLSAFYTEGKPNKYITQAAIQDMLRKVAETQNSIPKTEEAKVLARGIDKMPKEEREQALAFFQVAFSKYFREEND